MISLAALYVQGPSLSDDTFQFLLVTLQPLVGHDLIIEASWSHSDTLHSTIQQMCQ